MRAQSVQPTARTCAIYGTNRSLDRHHIEPRRTGGSRESKVLGEDNLITPCRICHRSFHEGGWVLERSPQLLRVVDGRSGDEIMRRHCDHDFDATDFLDLLSRLDISLVQAVHPIRYLDDDQLVEAFRAARSLGKRASLLEAATLYEAQRRSVCGDRTLEGIARRFEISLRHAQKYALVWRLFFAKEQHDGGRDEGQPFLRGPDGVNVDAVFLEEPSWLRQVGYRPCKWCKSAPPSQFSQRDAADKSTASFRSRNPLAVTSSPADPPTLR